MVSHILMIDDRLSLPRFIAMELHAEGYQVSIHCSDVSNLSIVPELKPDLIVLNWELRCASGPAIYHRLRSVNNEIPIVVITANDDNSYYLALKSGAQTCLTKPFLMNDLLKAIECHLKPAKKMMACSSCS